jgi:hypothetical protein
LFNLDVAEYLLNNLCCLSFRTNFTRPKFLTLIQIWFLLKKDRADLENDLRIANEQSKLKKANIYSHLNNSFLVNLSSNLSNLISNNNYTQIASLLNQRTLNNDTILNKIIEEYDFKIPGNSHIFSFFFSLFNLFLLR